MPLPLRKIEPAHVSRNVLPERVRVPNDLEATANGTLANVILQLSSLSHHAEELFTDLIQVGSEIANRANNLQARIDRLAVKVVQLDGASEESASMQESLNTKPFQSSMSFDQQVVSRPTLPPAMLKTYHHCDKPPPLDKLNVYRDDGKDGLKFYTDPSYFFDLWRQEMLKDTEKVVKKHQSVEQQEPHKPKNDGGQRPKRVRKPGNTRDRHKHNAMDRGELIMTSPEFARPGNAVPEVPDGVLLPPEANALMQQRQNAARPSSIDIDTKGYPGYSESPYGNGNIGDLQARGDFRLHMNHHHLNRTHSQSQYEHDVYYSPAHSQSLNQRYYSHGTPPPAYSDSSTVSLNAYSNSRNSMGILSNSSTPRGTPAGSSTPNNLSNGYGFRPSQPPPAPPPGYNGTPPSSHSGTPTRSMRGMNSRDTLPPPPPPPTELENQSQPNGHNQYSGSQGLPSYDRNSSMPPPPPPPVEDETDEPLPPPPPTPDQEQTHSLRAPMIPEDQLPPSPPPPPPEAPAPPPPPPIMSAPPPPVGNGIKKEKKNVPAPAWDGRSELLKAIRDGIELRKVDKKESISGKEDKTGSTYCDVASILARRVAVEMSDSDSESESEYDSDGWDEASA